MARRGSKQTASSASRTPKKKLVGPSSKKLFSNDDRVWVVIDRWNQVFHRIKTGVETICRTSLTDDIGRWSIQELPPRKVSCLLCLAES